MSEQATEQTDRELLELAAKAAGMTGWRYTGTSMSKMLDPTRPESTGSIGPNWNPLTDDGDALRLAVELHMTVRCYMGNVCAQISVPGQRNAYVDETNRIDPLAATRRAIVRAAAAIAA